MTTDEMLAALRERFDVIVEGIQGAVSIRLASDDRCYNLYIFGDEVSGHDAILAAWRMIGEGE